MVSTKAALKTAKSALDSRRFDEAISQAETVLESDGKNYFAHLFLGRAYDQKGEPDDAAKAYGRAAQLKPVDPQAWQGLLSVYETQGNAKVDDYIDAAGTLAGIYADGEKEENKHRCQSVLDRLTSFADAHGTRPQRRRALATQLPADGENTDSPLYAFLEGRLPHPAHTYAAMAALLEAEETERVNREVGERRTRLGARVAQVTAEVKREVFGPSALEGLYAGVIDWTPDDAVRREFEEKLLRRAYEALVVMPAREKAGRRERVREMARGMVVIRHPFELAWTLELEWRDAEALAEYDESVLRQYVEFFPDSGLAMVVAGFLKSGISPFTPAAGDESESDEDQGGVSLVGPEDVLVRMTEGLADAKSSTLAHRLIGDYYIYLEEYESAVETLRKGLKLLTTESHKSGLIFQNNMDAMNSALATALVQYQSPKNHPEAKSLFNSILTRNETFSPALIGVGLILEDEEDYSEAINFLTQALEREPTNVRVGAELAWCKALNGDYATGLEELERYLSNMDARDARTRDLRAQTLYRVGTCLWRLDASKAARKDRKRAYARFLSAIKANVNFAPAYTSLGIYYEDYARDRKRARQCFQKAFELSAAEVEAAERLARSFADQGDWDIVELVAQRVVDSGRTRPSPGSKRKGISWPHSALGVAQMNRQAYPASVTSFLAALRIRPDDYHSWVGLGESYHNSGRYVAAAKAFRHAEGLVDDDDGGPRASTTGESWFTRYMLANVQRELGEHSHAAQGYRDVLAGRPHEFGVAIALLQTLVEQGWRCIDTGFFGRAAASAIEAVSISADIVGYMPHAFNLWRSLGDACAICSWVQGEPDGFPFADVTRLLETAIDVNRYQVFADMDGIDGSQLAHLIPDETTPATARPLLILTAAILAHKRAILSCADDVHAQAVAWYNLGWTLHRTQAILASLPTPPPTPLRLPRLQRAALRAFKRAIELEPANPSFWLALGASSAPLNARVAQHALVRALHLDERSALAWTALGALCLRHDDHDLAHAAVARAQAADPDFAPAWLGAGVLASRAGDAAEARGLFEHAADIAADGDPAPKRAFAASAFDRLASGDDTGGIAAHVRPLLALQQLRTLASADVPARHLQGLLLERVGNPLDAADTLRGACDAAERDFEESEAPQALARFAVAKADLARCRLAAGSWADAADDADVVLGLVEGEDDDADDSAVGGLDAEQRRKLSLGARLTAGLALFYQHRSQQHASNGTLTTTTSDDSTDSPMDASIAHFRAALAASAAAPDVVCVLAAVLWARGDGDSRAVAREQLLDAAERAPDHVSARVLLGALAALEADWDTAAAARADLLALRTGAHDLGVAEVRQVERVVAGMAALEEAAAEGGEVERLREAQTAVLLAPAMPFAWGRLAEVAPDDCAFPAAMAKRTAARAVPPRGPLGAVDLAKACAGAGTVADAQRAVVLAPWARDGWDAFADGIAAG